MPEAPNTQQGVAYVHPAPHPCLNDFMQKKRRKSITKKVSKKVLTKASKNGQTWSIYRKKRVFKSIGKSVGKTLCLSVLEFKYCLENSQKRSLRACVRDWKWSAKRILTSDRKFGAPSASLFFCWSSISIFIAPMPTMLQYNNRLVKTNPCCLSCSSELNLKMP